MAPRAESDRPIDERLHDWLRDRVRAARLRARAERALPRAVRWRRWLGRRALDLVWCYVALNVLGPRLVPIVVAGAIECRVVDAATGAPVPGAVVRREEFEPGERTDPLGLATLVLHSAPSLAWLLPRIGTYRLGGAVHVEAPGFRRAEAALPETFDWPLSGSPRAAVTVRLER